MIFAHNPSVMSLCQLRQCPWRRLARRMCTSSGVRVRFAPSPTGQLHLGGLRTALYNYLFARANGGKFILRIEDTDQTRLVPGAQQKLIDILRWSQIQVDEGPNVPGDFGPYIQSERLDLYKEMTNKLLETKHAYRCFCSERRLKLLRKEAMQRGETPKYDNNCRHLTQQDIDEKVIQNKPFTVRLKLEHYHEPWHDLVYGPIVYDVASIEGDPILVKSDGYPTYHFANVVDDHHMKISHVLRGVEWQASTTKHVLLYKAFGWQPPQFGHLPLLMNKDGKKLSKRQGDVHVEHYRENGYFPETVLSLLTNSGSGFNVRHTAAMDMQQLIHNFDIIKLNTHSTRLDLDRVKDFNKMIFHRRLENSEETKLIANEFIELYEKNVKNEGSPVKSTTIPLIDHVLQVLYQMKNRISKVDDLLSEDHQYLWFPATNYHLPPNITKEVAINLLEHTLTLVKSTDSMEEDCLKVKIKQMCKSDNIEVAPTMKLLRKSLCDQQKGPSIAEMMSTLGRETTFNRLQQALDHFKSTV